MIRAILPLGPGAFLLCGIVGVHNYASNRVAVTDELLTRLSGTMAHRGPDAAGAWIDRSHRVGMGFRRLSIIDLSPNGNQPMPNEDGTLHLIFNGEIYNFRELRAGLEARGHRFRSRTDSEVILHLYEESGTDLVRHLDGMFAFALRDDRLQQWFLARDRLGVKPLYYTQQHGVFLFASEIKAMLAHPLVTRELDVAAMGNYLTFKASPAPNTMFEGIRKLPPGSMMTADQQGNLTITQYWDVAAPGPTRRGTIGEGEAVEQVRELFAAAVDKRMVADVPVGAFLSGGLDSSAMVARMSELGGTVRTFAVGVRDLPQYSEFAYARMVAERFGTDHHEIEIGVREVEEYLPQLVYQQDEPLADPVCVPLYYLSKLAAGAGVPVVLVGEGSDEQFFGYDTRVDFLRRYQRFWRPLLTVPPPLLRGGHQVASAIRRATGMGARAERVLAKAAAGRALFYGSMAFGEGAKGELLTEGAIDDGCAERAVEEIMADLHRQLPNPGIEAQVMFLDLRIRLAELLLMRVDKVTMSQSLEARAPFLDYRLMEYTMALPLALKLKRWNPKHLLKAAMRGTVPDAIIDRPKQAFAAPIEEWLRTGLGDMARRVILESGLRQRGLFRYDRIEQILAAHQDGRADHGVQIWTLMNLSAWHDHWIDGKPLT